MVFIVSDVNIKDAFVYVSYTYYFETFELELQYKEDLIIIESDNNVQMFSFTINAFLQKNLKMGKE